jgi:lysyl-tRNA synthetase class 2
MTENLSENELLQQRRSKLDELRKKDKAYPNSFRRDSLSQDLKNQYAQMSKEELEENSIEVSSSSSLDI